MHAIIIATAASTIDKYLNLNCEASAQFQFIWCIFRVLGTGNKFEGTIHSRAFHEIFNFPTNSREFIVCQNISFKFFRMIHNSAIRSCFNHFLIFHKFFISNFQICRWKSLSSGCKKYTSKMARQLLYYYLEKISYSYVIGKPEYQISANLRIIATWSASFRRRTRL